MASACVFEEKTLIHELTQGLQFAERLRVNLHSPETREVLIQKILSVYDNALFALQSGDSAEQSPVSIGSPRITPKKRKGSMTWEDEVRICNGNGLNDDIDDGFHWRKYGQKNILGARFPRCYYRCSYQKAQKCFATKHVQRKDEDPTEFDIAYKGRHTCHLGAQSASTPPSPENHEITPTLHHLSPPNNAGEMLTKLRANLSVNTSDLGGDTDTVPFSFSFPSASLRLMDDPREFHFPNHYGDELWPVYSQAVISPATSESNVFTDWGSSSSLVSPATTSESKNLDSLKVYSPPFTSPATSESIFFTQWGSSSSLDLLADPTVDSDFEFMKSLF